MTLCLSSAGRVPSQYQEFEVDEPPWVKAQLRRQRKRHRCRIAVCVIVFIGLLVLTGVTLLVWYMASEAAKETPPATVIAETPPTTTGE